MTLLLDISCLVVTIVLIVFSVIPCMSHIVWSTVDEEAFDDIQCLWCASVIIII